MDWISLALSLLGLILNTQKKILCWPIWLVGNVTWSLFAIQTDQVALLLLQVAFAVVNVFGWISWKSVVK